MPSSPPELWPRRTCADVQHGRTTARRRCDLPNATATCRHGGCEIARCVAPFRDCNHHDRDGCETNVSTDLRHCGACGTVCRPRAHATPTCTAGACGFTCSAGFGNCDGNAANGCEASLGSTASCGRCGHTCVNNTVCDDDGDCVCSAENHTLCGGFCVDIHSDPRNCGTCGMVCASGVCTDGLCG